MRKNIGIKLAISIGAIAVIALRFAFPHLSIDAITLGLIIVAILPWISSIIESAEFPGGWKVKFRDIEEAGRKVTGEVPSQDRIISADMLRLQLDAAEDPNLALVGLRIEIEKRLRAIAHQNGLPESRPASALARDLQNRGVLADSSVSGLQELIAAGNKAAHGARVEPQVSDWARNYGPRVLAALDSKLDQ